MTRSFLVLTLMLATSVVLADPPKPSPKSETPPEPMPVTRIPVRAVAHLPRALKYRLLPDPLDLVHGNAAPFWLRAGESASETTRSWVEKERAAHKKQEYWEQEDRWRELPLKDLPQKEVRAYLETYRTALHLAEEAAKRDSCDWELPPLTFQTFDMLPMAEIQNQRRLSSVLTLRFRLQLAEGHLDDAVHTIQIGMAQARDVAKLPTLIHSLVAIALESITLGLVWQLEESPDAPPLYWAVTALPRPFIDVRPSMQYEFNTVYRSFPRLRQLDQGALSENQVQSILNDILSFGSNLSKSANKGDQIPDWLSKVTVAALIAKDYPAAQRYLTDHGRPAKEVNAMPAVQAVALAMMEEYNRRCDDTLKWFMVPPWEGRPHLDALEKQVKQSSQRHIGDVILHLLIPAVSKVGLASNRGEHQLAGLRCAEAIRLYAAQHDGKLPQALRDITELPLPVDPYTGKGFDDNYTRTGDKAILIISPGPGMPESVGRRYEFTPAP